MTEGAESLRKPQGSASLASGNLNISSYAGKLYGCPKQSLPLRTLVLSGLMGQWTGKWQLSWHLLSQWGSAVATGSGTFSEEYTTSCFSQ